MQHFRQKQKNYNQIYKKGLLKPEKVKNEKGILEYRFKKFEIENFKNSDKTTRQTTRQNQKVEIKNNDTLSLLNDTMKLLQK